MASACVCAADGKAVYTACSGMAFTYVLDLGRLNEVLNPQLLNLSIYLQLKALARNPEIKHRYYIIDMWLICC
jgi:hypothetical protein